MSLALKGIHHLTAITADAPGNLRFYTQLLGLRLVKKTVNQDDTSAYHLFYADGKATPGTDITFFDWPAPRERRGTHAISRTSLRVAGAESLAYWRERLAEAGTSVGEIRDLDGRASLDFEDPEGQRLRLVDDGGAGEANPWDASTVPAEHQIRGLGPITISVPDLSRTAPILTTLMNMREARTYEDGGATVHVFEMGEGGPAAELHVAVEPGLPQAGQGAGGVHHVAFRAADVEELHQWTERLKGFRLPSSGEVERYYFRSLYFREPNGILFEIATDGPGFAVDEPMESLGESLSLPPFLEGKRAAIEANLKPLK
ncbi:ring-cleaving dioxygenase [Aurantimonas endophytica]|uniref:Glyoxalase family protein n=1 Tax=Aurantimonas endophytica TaxID=1522175 RepID=A0A7W6HFU9_9HYPH|nr:ring-cleaving dioxygenase [Aurantimonas endophytica]MBB4004168.1 glyoxalase family protein [Aurantimonas endophytica]MCO6405011.1 ring-cleaving dioxygenase [Aurantimonas endophytica]